MVFRQFGDYRFDQHLWARAVKLGYDIFNFPNNRSGCSHHEGVAELINLNLVVTFTFAFGTGFPRQLQEDIGLQHTLNDGLHLCRAGVVEIDHLNTAFFG